MNPRQLHVTPELAKVLSDGKPRKVYDLRWTFICCDAACIDVRFPLREMAKESIKEGLDHAVKLNHVLPDGKPNYYLHGEWTHTGTIPDTRS